MCNFFSNLCAEYLEGSNERKEISNALKNVADTVEEIPIVIGDEKFTTNDVRYQVMVIKFSFYILELLNAQIVIHLKMSVTYTFMHNNGYRLRFCSHIITRKKSRSSIMPIQYV